MWWAQTWVIRALAGLLVGLGVVTGAYVKGRMDGADVASARWSAKVVEAEREARKREHALQDAADQLAKKLERRSRILAERVATADAAVQRLLQSAADADARASQAPECAGTAADAAAARRVSAACAQEYRDVAAVADQRASQITGLLDYLETLHGHR